jgi:hypothetical protein
MIEPMNIYSLNGDKVKIIIHEDGEFNGYEYDITLLKTIDPEKEYTVDYTNIGSYHTDLYLEEFPGIMFNSVCFYNVDKSIMDYNKDRDRKHTDWYKYNDDNYGDNN